MKKVILKNFLDLTEKEHELILTWRNSPNIRQYMFNNGLIERNEHNNFLKKLKHRKDSIYWLAYVDNEPIGVISLQNINYEKKQAEWGIYIGPDEMRGKGYGKLLIYYLLRFYFEEMKFKILITNVHTENCRAISLYRKFGFKETSNKIIIKRNFINMLFTIEDWEREKERLKCEAGENS